MDAFFYLLDAMRLFSAKSLDEIRGVAFAIGLQEQYGLDINDPKESISCDLLRYGDAVHNVRQLHEDRAEDRYWGWIWARSE